MTDREPSATSQLFRPSRVETLRDVYDALQIGRYLKARKAVIECRKSGLKEHEGTVSRILEAQIERRRSAKGSLYRAVRILDGIRGDDVEATFRPLFHYEQGYVRQMVGDHDKAIQSFEASRRAAEELNDRYSAFESVVAILRRTAVEISARPADALARDRERYGKIFDALVTEAGAFHQPFAGRWEHNILGWKWRLYLKCAEPSDSAPVFEEYRQMRERQDVLTGYARSGGSYACGSAAMILLNAASSEDDLREVLRLVSRALVSLLSFRTRPEGVRDFLLTFERAIELLVVHRPSRRAEYQAALERSRAVRPMILDGTSFLDPHGVESRNVLPKAWRNE